MRRLYQTSRWNIWPLHCERYAVERYEEQNGVVEPFHLRNVHAKESKFVVF